NIDAADLTFTDGDSGAATYSFHLAGLLDDGQGNTASLTLDDQSLDSFADADDGDLSDTDDTAAFDDAAETFSDSADGAETYGLHEVIHLGSTGLNLTATLDDRLSDDYGEHDGGAFDDALDDL